MNSVTTVGSEKHVNPNLIPKWGHMARKLVTLRAAMLVAAKHKILVKRGILMCGLRKIDPYLSHQHRYFWNTICKDGKCTNKLHDAIPPTLRNELYPLENIIYVLYESLLVYYGLNSPGTETLCEKWMSTFADHIDPFVPAMSPAEEESHKKRIYGTQKFMKVIMEIKSPDVDGETDEGLRKKILQGVIREGLDCVIRFGRTMNQVMTTTCAYLHLRPAIEGVNSATVTDWSDEFQSMQTEFKQCIYEHAELTTTQYNCVFSTYVPDSTMMNCRI